MKRIRLFTILAATSVALLALPAYGKIAPTEEKQATTSTNASKYSIMIGYGYTSLNQVNQSRYGLQGGRVIGARDFGKYFALTVDGAYFKMPISNANGGNPGDPSVWQALAGPELHAELYGRVSAFTHALIGVAHTGGEQMSPATSLAGGFGIGLEYKWNQKIALRLSGDDIMASFSLRNNTPALAYSPHRTSNSQMTLGVVYRF